MPGSFGTKATADGVEGITKGKDSAGVFGKNTAKSPPTSGGDGGAGVLGTAQAPHAAGVFGVNTHAAKGVGVQGNGPEAGVSGFADIGAGVRGHSNHGNGGEAFAHDGDGNALLAVNDSASVGATTDGNPRGCGVVGVTTVQRAAGVFAANNSDSGVGVQGNGPGAGTSGYSKYGAGTRGVTNGGNGVEGFATKETLIERAVSGVAAKEAVLARMVERDDHAAGRQVTGHTVEQRDPVGSALKVADEIGVAHTSERAPQGIRIPVSAVGIVERDRGPTGNGVWGHTNVPKASGVFGSADPGARGAAGVTGVGPIAGQFLGNAVVTVNLSVGRNVSVGGDVTVTGDVFLTGADIAEDFDAIDLGDATPGTVMVISDDGSLRPSDGAYDVAVAGVVSAAGEFRPGVVLDRAPSSGPRVTLALVGKVRCWADAEGAPIRPGDLLTTSATSGHAMKVTDPQDRAVGAVLGKALRPLASGRALIPILVALQ